MRIELLAYAKMYREVFDFEEITPKNDALFLVESGKFEFRQNGVDYIIEKNQAAFIKNGVLCKRKIIEPTTFYYFRFNSDEPLFDSGKICLANIGRVCSNMKMIDRDMGHPKMSAIYEHILYDLYYIRQLELKTTHRKINDKSDKMMENIILTIENQLDKNVSLDKYAKMSGFSYVQFARKFKIKTGSTPINYIKMLRIMRAKELIADTELRIKEISLLCGFENEYYFSNAFKSEVGMSPTKYRDHILSYR